jgi:hypothetical protein
MNDQRGHEQRDQLELMLIVFAEDYKKQSSSEERSRSVLAAMLEIERILKIDLGYYQRGVDASKPKPILH